MSKSRNNTVRPQDWPWLFYERHEPRFVSEDSGAAAEFVVVGREALEPPNLRQLGLEKIVKINENIMELNEPLNIAKMSAGALCEIIGIDSTSISVSRLSLALILSFFPLPFYAWLSLFFFNF